MLNYLEKIVANNATFTEREIELIFILSPFEIDPDNVNFGKTNKHYNYTISAAYVLQRYLPAVNELFKRICPNVKLSAYIVLHNQIELTAKRELFALNTLKVENFKSFVKSQAKVMHYPLKNEFLPHYDLNESFSVNPQAKKVFSTQSVLFNAYIPFESQTRKKIVSILTHLQNSGMIIIDNPEFNNAPFLNKHNFRDSKDLARKFMPDHYPIGYEGNNLEEAVSFLRTHRYVVLKPSFLSNAKEIYFFNLLAVKTPEEVEKIEKKFIEAYKYIQSFSNKERVIVQKFMQGLFTHGEKRVYALNGKILPFAIQMRQSDPNLPFKPDHGAESAAILLEEIEIRTMIKLTERLRKLNSYLLGADITRDIEADGSERIVMFEANFISPGFFPRIAGAIETQRAEVKEWFENLPKDLQNYIEIDPIESLMYKPIFRNLRLKEARGGQDPLEKIKKLRAGFFQDPGLAA